ncbi:MAG: hypothetical protein ACPL7I_03425, partial [Myxococcota bacterium]
MKKYFIFSLLLFILTCQGVDKGDNPNIYEAFIAKVESIIVSSEIDLSEPVVIYINGRFEDDCSDLARIS